MRVTALLAVMFAAVGSAAAPRPAEKGGQIALVVPAGTPLQVALEKKVPVQRAGIPVAGRVLEPVYVFDRIVIPAGSEVLGRVSEVEPAPRRRRIMAMANGNFPPLRTAHLEFDTLVFPDGRKVSLQTAVSQGSPQVVHLIAGGNGKKKGRVSQVAADVRQQVKQREHETVQAVKAPGKMKRLKSRLAAELPYHRPSLAAGTQFTAELKAPLNLGQGSCPSAELEKLGSEIPPGSLVQVRLLTPLSSATDHPAKKVEAMVSEPVMTSDHQLVLPQGSRLEGRVTQSRPARRLARNGQLRFTFGRIELPQGAVRNVEASLEAADVDRSANLKLDAEGGAHAVRPKKGLIVPAVDVLLATSSLDGFDPHRRPLQEGSGGEGATGGAVRGGAGFGLLGSAIGLLARSPVVSAGFAFYAAGRSVYSHVLARGNEVVFPKNTPMEILIGTHQASTPPGK